MARERLVDRELSTKTMIDEDWLFDSAATRYITPQRELFVQITKYKNIVKFGNKKFLPSKGKDIIRVYIDNRIQIMNNILYMPKMGSNLLSIIALNKKSYEVRFDNIRVKIINVAIERIVITSKTRNKLYQITDSTYNKTFISSELSN